MDSYLVLLRAGFTIATNCYQLRGALLPHLFTLTDIASNAGGSLSAALSVGLHPPGVTWRSILWSPDFPPHLHEAIAWPTLGAFYTNQTLKSR